MKISLDPRLPIVKFDEAYLKQLNFRLYEIFRDIAKSNNAMSDGFLFETTGVTASYTATTADQLLLVNNTSAITVTLPAASEAEGKRFVVKKASNNNHPVTVVVSGSGTIDDSTSQVITTPYTSLDFVSDGSEYWII